MIYDNLVRHVSQQGIDIREEMIRGRIKGLYADNVIWINKSIPTANEKACVIAEELGHYYTTEGHILDVRDVRNLKQELRARSWAYEHLVSFKKIIQAHHAGISGRHEVADYLGVTEDFLQAAIDRYKQKHGLYATYEKYTICFEPLAVIESFE